MTLYSHLMVNSSGSFPDLKMGQTFNCPIGPSKHLRHRFLHSEDPVSASWNNVVVIIGRIIVKERDMTKGSGVKCITLFFSGSTMNIYVPNIMSLLGLKSIGFRKYNQTFVRTGNEVSLYDRIIEDSDKSYICKDLFYHTLFPSVMETSVLTSLDTF